MARRRMIDPKIWQSEDFSKLSPLAQLVFIGLFSHADDMGRGRGKAAFIKSMLFPYDENMKVSDVESALNEIALNMSVTFYICKESEYYVLENWNVWQKVEKAQSSTIPEFSEGMTVIRGECTEQSPTVPQPITDCSPNNHRTITEQSPTVHRTISPKRREDNIREDKGRESEENAHTHSRDDIKHKRGEYGWVKLSDKEYSRLIDDHGEAKVLQYIAIVDEKAQMTGNKNKWKDWNLTIRKAIRDNWGNANNGSSSSNPF